MLLWSILLLSINVHFDQTVQFKNMENSQKIPQDDFSQFLQESFTIDANYLNKIYAKIFSNQYFGDLSGVRTFLGKKQASGWLTKQGGKRKTWKKRWFMLHPDRLCYYKSVNVSWKSENSQYFRKATNWELFLWIPT
jgi:hypothetical protein